MSLQSAVADRVSLVEAELNYLSPSTTHPRTYTYDPPAGEPRTTIVNDPHLIEIVNARPILSKVSLDEEGFDLVEHRSAVRDFYNDSEVKGVYYAEAEQLLKRLTGADRVHIFDHTVRRRVAGGEDRRSGVPRQPVPRVHVDHTVKSGPQRVRDLLPRCGRASARTGADHQSLAPHPRSPAGCAAGRLRCIERQAGATRSFRSRLSGPRRRDLFRSLRSRTSLVLRSRDEGRRGAALKML